MKSKTKAQTPPENDLLVEERRRLIKQLIDERERITVDELSAQFNVSLVTIRGDLNALAEIGAIVRTHGGAVVQRDVDLPIHVKKTIHHAEKVRIAAAAARLIVDGETIILDSGTTTAEIAKQIRGLRLRGINVITNALNIAMLLAEVAHVRLFMLGGLLRENAYAMSGPQAEAALGGLQADRLFLGVDSLDPDIGVMTPHVLEARLNALMIERSRHVVVVTDSSKLQRRNLSVIAPIEKLHQIITDKGANSDVVAALRAKGVTVVLV